MSRKWTYLLVLLLVLAAAVVAVLWEPIAEIQAMKVLRYETGEHKGARYCGTCHKQIYEEWSKRSRHAVAVTASTFLEFRDKLKGNFVLNAVMGESICYACHGSKYVAEGVNCETCHGPAPGEVPIMETHERKYKPALVSLKNPDFCAKCHELGDAMTPYGDWLASEAARAGVTCQGCHMKPRMDGQAYHGFDSAALVRGLYRRDLSIDGIEFSFPTFSLTVANRIIGHGIPAGGPSRVLVLEISFLDAAEKAVHKIVKTFAKKFELMPIVGLMPNNLIENTQLRSGEKRRLNYTLPSSVSGKVTKAILTLKFYEVSDEYQGDIEKAHWISEPIVERHLSLDR